MSQLIINTGTAPNDGTGDKLRTAFGKINTNFTEVYSTIPTSASTFTQDLLFNTSKYYSSYDQWSNISFTNTSGGTNIPLNVIYMQINLNRLYSVSFGSNFESNRNDIDGTTAAFDFWFVYKPNGKVAYSIVKTGTYQPIAPIPYSGYTVAKYGASNVELDATSGKITKIVNTYNDALSLYSNTDSTRPTLDTTNNRIVFDGTALTENLNGISGKTFVSGTTWCLAALIEFKHVFGGTAMIMDNWTTNPLALRDMDTMYLNTVLTTQTKTSGVHNKLAGAHIMIWNQTSGRSELYFDDTLMISSTTATGKTLTGITNILSTIVSSSVAAATEIKYLWDMIIYNKDMNSTERTDISNYFKNNYPTFNPSNAPTITGYMTSGFTSGYTFYTGETLHVTYTVSTAGVTASKLVIVWLQGGGVLRGVTVSDSVTSVVIPSTITKGTQYWTRGYILDQNGLASNAIDYIYYFTIA